MDRILIVDDEPGVRLFLKKILSKDYEVITAKNGEEALDFISNETPKLILLDVQLPGKNGLDVLEQIQKYESGLPVVLITAFGDTDKAIQAMDRGAFDYLTKPLDIEIVRHTVENGLRVSRLHHGSNVEIVASDDRTTGERLIGNSAPMIEIYKVIGQVAKSDVTVLIKGESGTGKDLIARTLHRYSRRREHPFVAMNCAAIPDDLVESELFGYDKGAFTGANSQGKRGKFEEAEGGTLFLDEIGDMSLGAQAKVLRVLHDGTFQRVGGTQTLRPSVRILAATNNSLEDRIRDGQFREDLFHRLNVVTIEVPPLREHKEDIGDLLLYFVQRFNSELQLEIKGFEHGFVEYLHRYDWPGNIREFENRIKKVMVMCKNDYLNLDQIKEEISEEMSMEADRIQDLVKGFSSIVEGALQRCIDCSRTPYETIISNVEKVLVKKSLEMCAANQVQAARTLGITRTTLRKKMKDFEL